MAKRELERTIENYVVKKSKLLGYINRKMNGLGFRAWPDRLFIHWSKVSVWIEFKRPGEDLTPDQAHLHKQLLQRGQDVKTFHTRQEALDYLARRIDKVGSKGIPKTRAKIPDTAGSRRTLPRPGAR